MRHKVMQPLKPRSSCSMPRHRIHQQWPTTRKSWSLACANLKPWNSLTSWTELCAFLPHQPPRYAAEWNKLANILYSALPLSHALGPAVFAGPNVFLCGLVVGRFLSSHTGERTDLHFCLFVGILANLRGFRTDPTQKERQWDRNNAGVCQRVNRQVHVREERGLSTPQHGREQDQGNRRDQPAIHRPEGTARGEVLPEQ